MIESIIEIQLNKEIKETAEKLFREKYNLSLEQACLLFLKECISCNGIPFEIKL